MKCPHCNQVSKAKVMESRPHEGQTYRRRTCGKCFANFVTCENAPVGLKMPNETQSAYRAKNVSPKPEQGDGIIRNSGAHLQFTWR